MYFFSVAYRHRISKYIFLRRFFIRINLFASWLTVVETLELAKGVGNYSSSLRGSLELNLCFCSTKT